MKAISLREPQRFEMIDIDPPADPGPGEALVQVHNIGICGTDVSGYFGKMPLMTYPRILGHELGVEVVAVGDGVSNVAPGDRCSVEPYLNCVDGCIACRRGAPNCCATLEVLGVHTDGGMRPRFLLPARKLHVSTRLEFEQLALVETLGIGAHAVDRGAPGADDVALIIGAGPIGLATYEFVRLSGATTIFMDLNEERLRFASEVMNCDHTLVARGDLDGQLRELTGGDLANVVFDAHRVEPLHVGGGELRRAYRHAGLRRAHRRRAVVPAHGRAQAGADPARHAQLGARQFPQHHRAHRGGPASTPSRGSPTAAPSAT